MSETQSTLFNRRACYLWIAGAFILVLIVVVRFLSPLPAEPEAVKVQAAETVPRRVHQISPVFDAEAFYRTIIDNNLFRPLGWTPPRPIEPYRLIGTILPRDANTPSKAILETTVTKQTHIVSVGDKIGASTEVVLIGGKSVVLSRDGERRTLHLRLGF